MKALLNVLTISALLASPLAFAVDTDGDGLTDEKEVLLGLNPNSTDSNGDGTADGYEPLPPRSWSTEYHYEYIRTVDIVVRNFVDCRKVFLDLPEYFIYGETFVFQENQSKSSSECPDSGDEPITAFSDLRFLSSSLGPLDKTEAAVLATRISCVFPKHYNITDLPYCGEYEFLEIPFLELTPVDTDGDGVDDFNDDAPTDPNIITDTDGDGIDDLYDEDDDGDGLTDEKELLLGSDQKLTDTDGDGAPDGYAPIPPNTSNFNFSLKYRGVHTDSLGLDYPDCELVFEDTLQYLLAQTTYNFALNELNSDTECLNAIDPRPDVEYKQVFKDYYHFDGLQIDSVPNASTSITIINRYTCSAFFFGGVNYSCFSQSTFEVPVLQLEELDTDGDGIVDFDDDYPTNPALPFQDTDNDGIGNHVDNCPNTANLGQSDNDNDGIGNACDDDIDGDGVDDTLDSHPRNANYFSDFDGDKLNAHQDNCPFVSNAVQSDSDGDGFGNACDNDNDNDGVNDALDSHPLNSLYFTDFDRDLFNAHEDNCPFVKNPGQSDNDGDGLGNACDLDLDGDGVDDASDNYPRNPNLW